MAKAIYRNKGETIEYTNPSTTKVVEAGEIVSLTSRIGIAAAEIPAGAVGSVNVVGVYELPKTSSLAIAAGDLVYFSTSTNKVTKTDTDVPCGFAVEAAAAADSIVYVKIG